MYQNKPVKNKILTFGFDDCEIHDRRLCDLFRKYGMKSTFFLLSDQLSFRCDFHRYGEDTTVERVSPQEIKSTYAGMEVATHTANHRCSPGDLEHTVVASAKYLSDLCGYSVTGMAYPGGHYTEELIQELGKLGILYARTIECTHRFDLPEQLLAWHPTCKYDDPDILRIAEEFLNYEGTDPGLLYIYGHSYELTRREHAFSWDGFEELLERLSGREDIWYATNEEVARYLQKG